MAGWRRSSPSFPQTRAGRSQLGVLGRRTDPAASFGRLRQPRRPSEGRCKADVIFAFFGYNESFAGQGGMEKFSTTWRSSSSTRSSQKYNGKMRRGWCCFRPSRTRICTIPTCPTAPTTTAASQLYTAAMAEVANASTKCRFVDLFVIRPSAICGRDKAADDQWHPSQRHEAIEKLAAAIDAAAVRRAGRRQSVRSAWRNSAARCSTRT